MGQYTISFSTPAELWTEALPIGNGRLGAMVFSGPLEDRVSLSEEGIWDNTKVIKTNPRASTSLSTIQELLFAGEVEAAEELAAKTMMGVPDRFGSFQTLGDLTLSIESEGGVGMYRRQLCMDKGIITTDYLLGNCTVRKRYLVSNEYDVLLIQLSLSEPQPLTIGLSRIEHGKVSSQETGSLCMEGQVNGSGTSFLSKTVVTGDFETVEFRDGSLHCSPGSEFTIYLGACSGCTRNEAELFIQNQFKKAITAGAALIKEANKLRYRHFMARFSLELDSDDDGYQDLPLLLKNMAQDGDSAVQRLVPLFIQYCRYLLLAASVPGTLPSTLQGIWNDKIDAPWLSDFHTNINLQMNYWPAEVLNLPETHLPLFHWLKRLSKEGEKTAMEMYNAQGWVLHHVSNCDLVTQPIAGIFGIWPMGGAWLCRHLYEHWAYGRSTTFLKEMAYPLSKSAALFILSFLVEAPEGTPCAGRLITNPSHSPENSYYHKDGSVRMFTYGATMDLEIIYDLFTNILEMADHLPVEAREDEIPFLERLSNGLHQLPPLRISQKTGGLQEWIEDYDEPEPGHRHISHLYAGFPSAQITPEKTPELAEAIRRSLDRRLKNEYHGTGWSLGWISCLFARLKDGDRGLESIALLLKEYLFPNLMCNAHGNPQVGDMGGLPAAVAEMLVQSHHGVIRLLPALPSSWPKGEVRGIRCRGGYTLSLGWRNCVPLWGQLRGEPGPVTISCPEEPYVDCGKVQRLDSGGFLLQIPSNGEIGLTWGPDSGAGVSE